jgi:hypothetical protein
VHGRALKSTEHQSHNHSSSFHRACTVLPAGTTAEALHGMLLLQYLAFGITLVRLIMRSKASSQQGEPWRHLLLVPNRYHSCCKLPAGPCLSGISIMH